MQILEQIKDILGDNYSENLPYGNFLSNQNGIKIFFEQLIN
jgi:hypothetical protein